jgi:hypothetical protein
MYLGEVLFDMLRVAAALVDSANAAAEATFSLICRRLPMCRAAAASYVRNRFYDEK